jgi:hypothetical protein
MLACDTYIK